MSSKNRKLSIDLGNYFSDKTETTIAKILQSVEGQSVREKSTRSSYYALKAEHRNYLLLKNLYLTQSTLANARKDAELNVPEVWKNSADYFQEILPVQARISRLNIYDLIDRLRPASAKKIKKESLQIALQ
jgi:transglutaminase/protease-like cytokinesis protein 3